LDEISKADAFVNRSGENSIQYSLPFPGSGSGSFFCGKNQFKVIKINILNAVKSEKMNF
jgi:hypothetical protein